MTSRHILAASVAMIAAIELAACASQPVSAFSYQLAPCPPTATAAGAALVPNPASPGESYPSATARPPAPAANALDVPGASGAGGTLQPTVPSCVAAVSNYDSPGTIRLRNSIGPVTVASVSMALLTGIFAADLTITISAAAKLIAGFTVMVPRWWLP
jgi:hypothetical protein